MGFAPRREKVTFKLLFEMFTLATNDPIQERSLTS